MGSDPLTIKCGIPQGTVLGPILFALYIHYLLTNHFAGDLIAHADDTVAIYNNSSWEHLKIK